VSVADGNGRGRLGGVEYAALVARVQATVTAAVPPGGRVLVVSKGDAVLLELPGLSAAHFPQDALGEYAGHHPPDSESAVSHLCELQEGGAEYLAIPATSRWWLDYYAGLAEHLAAHGEVVADAPGACVIYALARRPAQPPQVEEASEQSGPQVSAEQIRDYLEHLISPDSLLVVLESGGVAEGLAPLRAVALAPEELSRTNGHLAGALERLAESGADYLVVPRASEEWLERHAHVAERLQESFRKVAEQRHLCRVFELKGLSGA
jgi:hypothetical protein